MTAPQVISSTRFKKTLLATFIAALGSAPCVHAEDNDGEREITFIHTGDLHGDFHPHATIARTS